MRLKLHVSCRFSHLSIFQAELMFFFWPDWRSSPFHPSPLRFLPISTWQQKQESSVGRNFFFPKRTFCEVFGALLLLPPAAVVAKKRKKMVKMAAAATMDFWQFYVKTVAGAPPPELVLPEIHIPCCFQDNNSLEAEYIGVVSETVDLIRGHWTWRRNPPCYEQPLRT